MKKRFLAVPFLCAVALTSTGVALTASALDDSKEALTVQDVNYTPDLDGWGSMTLVNFGIKSGITQPTWGNSWNALDTTYVSYVDKTNTSVLETFENCGTSASFNRNGRAGQAGDLITIKEGFTWVGETQTYEMKQDISYLYKTEGSSWVVFNPTTLTPSVTELTVYTQGTAKVTFTTDYDIAPLSCSIADTQYATVTSDGLTATVSGLAEGTTTLNVSCGDVSTTVAITVAEPTAALQSISVTGEINAYKGATGLDLSGLTAKKIYDDGSGIPFEVTADMITGTYDLNTVGDYTLTVTAEEKTATVTLHVLELPALTVNSINLDWAGIMIEFPMATNTHLTTTQIPASGLNNFEVKNSSGENIVGNYNWVYHENYIFSFAACEVGTTVTFKKGFVFGGYEMKEDVTYIFAAAGQPFVVYDAAAHTPTSVSLASATGTNITYVKSSLQLTPTVAPATAATTVKYVSDKPEIATVDANGKITGVGVGTATITATAGSVSTTFAVEVQPELEFQNKLAFGNVYKIWVQKNGTIALPADFTAAPVYVQDGNEVLGSLFALTAENCTLGTVDTTTTGTKSVTATIAYDGKNYEMEIPVEVYAVVDMEIKEVSIVEWFAFSTFVQFPNSTENSANITNGALIPDASKLTYTRADGTNVGIGVYNLGGGNIAIFPAFDTSNGNMTIDNFNQAPFYQVGDRITLQAGLTGYLWTGEFAPTETDSSAIKEGSGMVIPECVLREEVSYVFDGSVWMIYVPYTDFEVRETVSVNVGSSVGLGAIRVPDNATEGNFYYESSNTDVVTVNANGRITGVSVGTATITVTLKDGVAGEIVKTVAVTVSDGIVKLEFAAGTTLTVAKGTETLDLSDLTASFVWASGKTEAADLSNAEVIGYDKDALGETEVTVRVSKDGNTYQAQLTINVVEGDGSEGGNGAGGCSGCSSTLDGVSIMATAALMLGGAALLVWKRKSER